MKTLLVGFGNPLRSDDGVGLNVAEAIDKLNLPGVDVRAVHQLNVDIAGDLEGYRRVIFVDASEDGPPVHMRQVISQEGLEKVSSHHLHPGILLALADKIYGLNPEMILCQILGENFDVGNGLSGPAKSRVGEAIKRILALLKEPDQPNA